MKNFENKAIEQQEPVECNQCGGTGDVSGEYPGVACPDCNGSGFKAQPDFTKHEVEQPHDWSEWVCPDPESYLMKCCDCGLVHEAQFKVVRYKSEDECEECDTVDDPNVQAVFRMRRSEQWTPKDTAYRPGGLAQPEQELLAWKNAALRVGEDLSSIGPNGYYNMTAQQWLDWAMAQQPRGNNSLAQPEQEPAGYADKIGFESAMKAGKGCDVWPVKGDYEARTGRALIALYTAPPKREWQGLTDEEIEQGLLRSDYALQTAHAWRAGVVFAMTKLKEKNT